MRELNVLLSNFGVACAIKAAGCIPPVKNTGRIHDNTQTNETNAKQEKERFVCLSTLPPLAPSALCPLLFCFLVDVAGVHVCATRSSLLFLLPLSLSATHPALTSPKR